MKKLIIAITAVILLTISTAAQPDISTSSSESQDSTDSADKNNIITLFGTIKEVGCVFDSVGVKLFILKLEEYSETIFEIPTDYGTQHGLEKILDAYNAQAVRATSGVMGVFFNNTGIEGRKLYIIYSISTEEKYIVKSLEWKK